MDTCVNEALPLLKTTCVQLIQKPTNENAQELQKVIHEVYEKFPSALQDLQGYLIFPLELHLKNHATKFETRRHIVDCLQKVLHCTEIITMGRLHSLYTVLFIQIFDKDKPGLVADVSEELKCSIMDCTSRLLKSCTLEVVKELYAKKNFPKLIQGLFMCVHMAHSERSRSVRISAVNCIMVLARVHKDTDFGGNDIRQQVGDVFMFVLPGVVGGLAKAMTADDNQGHKVTMISLQAWSKIITLVMEDGHMEHSNIPTELKLTLNPQLQETSTAEPLAMNMPSHDPEKTRDFLETQRRTPEWLQAAAEKLTPLIANLSDLQSNPHWLVRQELVSSCELFLTCCSRNLSACIVTFLEILIVLSKDDIENVASKSTQVIEKFSVICDSGDLKLLEILEENFFKLITKLPRIVHSKNDVQQLAALRLLTGYLRLLGASKLNQVLNSSNHLQRLTMTLIHVIELDVTGVSLLNEYALRDFDSSSSKTLTSSWKQLKHFTDQSILKEIEEICKLLSQFADVTMLSDHFLDIFQSTDLYHKEIVLLLNEILSVSCIDDVSPQHSAVIKNVLDVYLEPPTWYLPISTAEEDDMTNAETHSNLVLSCLLVEGIGKIAAALGRNFDKFLLRTLYVVLERAGSNHGLLAQAGIIAAQQVATAGGHESVAQLVIHNVDYFSYHVTMKLRRVEQNPGVLDVLNIVMRHSTMDVLPFVRDVVNDVLLQSFDTFQDSSALAFLRVFHTVVVCIRCALASTPQTETSSIGKLRSFRDVQAQFIDYRNAKRRVKEFVDNDADLEESDKKTEPIDDSTNISDILNENDEELPENDETKKPLPGHIQMTVSILTKSLHFLPSPNKQLKLVVLETLIEGLLVLANWENELLPIVHLIWSPLVSRFSDMSDPLLVNRSFSLLCTLASTAKDFIQQRTLKQIMPPILKFLKDTSSVSKKKDVGSAYRFTQKYKLQHELLDRLGQFCVNLALQNKDIDDVLSAVVPYLSILQPLPLQSKCVGLFQTIAGYNADAVWLKVYSLVEPENLLPSSERYLIGDKKTNVLEKNAQAILEFIKENDL